ncbi:MAG: hypothetical protein OXG95_03000 [Chloroflexi bacterium]|nr:hypothetical protein [Chloroflexota bacterium]
MDELTERERKRIDGLLERAAEHGPPRNREQNAALTGEDFFEFKAFQIRIFWRYASGRPDRALPWFHEEERPNSQARTHNREAALAGDRRRTGAVASSGGKQ